MVDGWPWGVLLTGPSYHGKTHLPGGTDPIIGFSASLPVAYANRTTTFTVAGDASFHQPAWTSVNINDDTVFTWPGTGSDSSLITATPGVYLIAYQVLTAATPASPDWIRTGATAGSPYDDFIGQTIGANTTTVKVFQTGVGSDFGWQNFEISTGGGDFRLVFVKDSGPSVAIDAINFVVCRLGAL